MINIFSKSSANFCCELTFITNTTIIKIASDSEKGVILILNSWNFHFPRTT